MLELIVVILVLLWALGFFGGFVASSLIHVLLVLALVIFIVKLARGERFSL